MSSGRAVGVLAALQSPPILFRVVGPVVGALSLMFGLLGGGAAQASPPGFCEAPMSRDFLKPIEAMAPVRRPPLGGKLPFAPQGVSLEKVGSRLMVGGGRIGFRLGDATNGRRRLNWLVSARLMKVNSGGRAIDVLQSIRRQLGTIRISRLNDFSFLLAEVPAFYRIDISIREQDTKELLGAYSNYIRVMRPWFDVQLLGTQSTLAPGGEFYTRLINLGTEKVTGPSEFGYLVEKFRGRRWIEVSSKSPSSKKGIRRRAILERGSSEGCRRLAIPDAATPGLYRVSQTVFQGALSPHREPVRLTAQFEVG